MSKRQTVKAGHEGFYKDVTITLADNDPDVWGADTEFTTIDKPIPRIDAIEKVTGRAKYTYDINRPDMLFAVLVTFPYPGARINSVDTSEAEAMPGVVAVEAVSGLRNANYAGTLVAVVAAETIQQARDAARTVKVDYVQSTFQVEAARSSAKIAGKTASGSQFGEKDVEGLSVSPTATRGNVSSGFQQADAIVEARYTTPITPHFCLETHGTVSEWAGDHLTVWSSIQGIWNARSDAASAGQVSASQTRLICQHMGGGFGSKFNLEDYDDIGIQIAKKTGRPVKIMADRWSDAVLCGYKPGAVLDVRIGAKSDGQLTAMTLNAAAITSQNGSMDAPMLDGYTCPNVSTTNTNIGLNLIAPRAFRGPGRPQGTFALEMAMDELAYRLDIDPLVLRLKNVSSHETDARETILKLGAERFGWKEKYRRYEPSPEPVKRGAGLAMCTWDYGSSANSCTVRCTIYQDGSVEVSTGSQDLGTGNRTAMTTVAAESLGIGVESIRVEIGDTDIGLNAPVSWGSISTGSIAPAVRTAAYRAQLKVFEPIAASWGTTVDDIQCKDGIVTSQSDPSKTMTWIEAAGSIGDSPITIMSSNRHLSAAGIQTGTRMRGAQFAEVEVNVETGSIRCVKILAVHECGKAMARKQAESQICGGAMMGASYALLEEQVMDPLLGRPLNANMESYKILGPQEAPEIEPLLIDVYDPINCACAKGLGEPPHIPTAAAIGCAVFNAIGVPVRDLPITPYRILSALQEKEG